MLALSRSWLAACQATGRLLRRRLCFGQPAGRPADRPTDRLHWRRSVTAVAQLETGRASETATARGAAWPTGPPPLVLHDEFKLKLTVAGRTTRLNESDYPLIHGSPLFAYLSVLDGQANTRSSSSPSRKLGGSLALFLARACLLACQHGSFLLGRLIR